MTTVETIPDAVLEALVSSDRFQAYVRTCGGDRQQAAALYQWNARISGAFHEVLHHLEIIYRNALHNQLEALHVTIPGRSPGAAWFDEPSWVTHRWFHDQAIEARDKAVASARHTAENPRPGKVVAELPFGFWRYLVTPHYEQSFWVPALDAAFPHLTGGSPHDRRRQVEHHVAPLHLLRNRIAHHEPIHGTISYRQKGSPREKHTLEDLHRMTLDLIGWISPAAANWIAGDVSQIPVLLRLCPGPRR